MAKNRLKSSRNHGAEASPDRATELSAAFERQVLQGVAAEWEHALWQLPQWIRDRLRRPLFSIRETCRRLGSWHAGRREISLSGDLVRHHGWDDVRDVLLHEMAHQVASQALGAANEPAHGQRFTEACRLLNADPAASGTYRSLRERLHQGEALSDADKTMVRIRKLMALAESSNPNEARSAMAKAYELIARHNIDLIERSERQSYISIFIGRPCLRHFRESYHLANLLQDYYFVQGVWVQAWVLEKGKMGRVLEISGTHKNVQIAEYVHASVQRYIDTSWKAYARGKRLARARKTDFAIGIIEGFKSTLGEAARELRPKSRSGCDLPVVTTDRALDQYVSRRYPRLRSSRRQGPSHDAGVLADGTETGKQLVIAKGISENDGFRRQLIEGPGPSAKS